jgi:hypothetical protein
MEIDLPEGDSERAEETTGEEQTVVKLRMRDLLHRPFDTRSVATTGLSLAGNFLYLRTLFARSCCLSFWRSF